MDEGSNIAVAPGAPERPGKWGAALALDRFEQAVIVALFVFLTWRVGHSENPFAPLLLVSEGMVVVFALIRRPSAQISVDLGDWLLAFVATCVPLLVAPVKTKIPVLVPLGVILFVLGTLLQIAAKFTLARSFGITPANRGVKRSGPYRLVRHPMYAGYLAINIGLLALMPAPGNLVIYAVSWIAQVLRLLAEERLLARDPAYRAFQAEVRWRLVPGLF